MGGPTRAWTDSFFAHALLKRKIRHPDRCKYGHEFALAFQLAWIRSLGMFHTLWRSWRCCIFTAANVDKPCLSRARLTLYSIISAPSAVSVLQRRLFCEVWLTRIVPGSPRRTQIGIQAAASTDDDARPLGQAACLLPWPTHLLTPICDQPLRNRTPTWRHIARL